MTRRSKYGVAHWKCRLCGSMFTRIGPNETLSAVPEKCHGCDVKRNENTNACLYRQRIPRRT